MLAMLDNHFESNAVVVDDNDRSISNEPMDIEQTFVKKHTTLVLAIGNLLMTDEGAGIHVLNFLVKQNINRNANNPNHTVIYLDGGTLSFSLAAHIENADNLIVIDAANLNAPPGTVKTFVGSQMDQQLGQCKLSVHEVGLIDLLDMVKLSGHWPKHRALVGIQPLTIADWSDLPSQPVKDAIPVAAAQVNNLIEEWQ